MVEITAIWDLKLSLFCLQTVADPEMDKEWCTRY